MEHRAMPETQRTQQVPLEAKSPFEMRINLGDDVPETDIRSALASGDMGFLLATTASGQERA